MDFLWGHLIIPRYDIRYFVVVSFFVHPDVTLCGLQTLKSKNRLSVPCLCPVNHYGYIRAILHSNLIKLHHCLQQGSSLLHLHVIIGCSHNYMSSACLTMCLVCFVGVVPVYLCVYIFIYAYSHRLKKCMCMSDGTAPCRWIKCHWIEFFPVCNIFFLLKDWV